MKTSVRSQGLRIRPNVLLLVFGFAVAGVGAQSLMSDQADWIRLLLGFVLGGIGIELVDRAYQRGDLERVS